MPAREQRPPTDASAIAIAEQVLEAAPDARDTVIRSLCDSDALATRVRAIVAASAAMGDFLQDPVLTDIGDDDPTSALGLPAGTLVGSYRLLNLIGSGSMGDVYAAEPGAGGEHVAVKIIRPGVVPREWRRRFEFEIATLARLDHPGITRLIASGVYSGEDGDRPFFVMELVRGQTIIEHVRDRRLGVEAILTLFLKACDAIEYAHRSGVIHRDLKPANIIVDDAASQPKILDFGVARSLDPGATLSSAPGAHLVGSLPYMSPEQASQSGAVTVDTRTDVFAMGAILYELLAGRPAYDPKDRSLVQLLHIVRHTSPTRLGLVARHVRGDLELIVHAAIERDVQRRYQSIAAFAEDLRRFLGREPIAIRPPTSAELLWSLVNKHRRQAVIAALVAAMLLGAIAFGAHQLVRATSAEKRADLLLDQVIAASSSLLVDVNQALRDKRQPLEAREIALRAATDYLERVQNEVGDDPRILTEVMRSYTQLGHVIGGSGDGSLGSYAGAATLFGKAAEIGRDLLRTHDSIDLRTRLADSVEELAMLSAGEACVSLFREAGEHVAAAAAMVPDKELQGRLLRRALQLRLRAATSSSDVAGVQACVTELRALTFQHPTDAALWAEFGLAARKLGESLVESDQAETLKMLDWCIDAFEASIRLGVDDFTNNRHIAQAQVLTVRCRAGVDTAEVLVPIIELGISRSARASGLQQWDNFARLSHLQTLYSAAARAVELATAPPPAGQHLTPAQIAARIAELVRRELAQIGAGSAAAHPHHLEPEVRQHIDEVLARLDAIARQI